MASCIRRKRCRKVRSRQGSQEPRESLESVQAERRRLDIHGGSLEEGLIWHLLDFVFSPDVKYVAAISEDGCLRVIDAMAER
jgi:hypothetical protein